MTIDPIWSQLLNDPVYGLQHLIAQALQDSGAKRIADWQQLFGEIEAAFPMSQEAGCNFGLDFFTLNGDASSVDLNNPSLADLTTIQGDIAKLATDQIPAPESDHYAQTMEANTCQRLKYLLATNPQNTAEINGILQVLMDFATPLPGGAVMVQNIENFYAQYPNQYWELQRSVDDFDQFLLLQQ
jgi:hypothetical protein